MGVIRDFSFAVYLTLLYAGMQAADEDIQPFIVNGNAANDAAFPWQLSFQRREKGRWFHACGASLIHESYALTASHCVYNRRVKNKNGTHPSYPIRDMRVVAGAHTIFPHDRDADFHRIQEFITPARLNFNYDLALLKLRVPANTSRSDIKVIRISNGSDVTPGSRCSATGWGTVTRRNARYSPTLREARMRLVSLKDCRGPGWGIGPLQTCATGIPGFATACFGDSGGPLSCKKKDGTSVFVGVLSLVYKQCNVARPNIFAKVSVYRKWLQALTKIDTL